MGYLTREEAKRDLTQNVNTHKCICEYLRLAYDEVYALPDGPIKDSLTDRLTDCLIMGKKMQDRLIYYARKYEPERLRKKVEPLLGASDRLAARRERSGEKCSHPLAPYQVL